MDKSISNRKFQCPHCEEKPFTTKANMLRHITRKHKDVFETEAGINTALWGSETPKQANDNPPIDSSIEGLSPQTSKTPNIDMLDEYLETVPSCIEPEPLPTDEYLIYLRNEYKKYEYLYRGLDNRIKWNENNSNVDIERHKTIFWNRMSYILTDIRDAKLPVI